MDILTRDADPRSPVPTAPGHPLAAYLCMPGVAELAGRSGKTRGGRPAAATDPAGALVALAARLGRLGGWELGMASMALTWSPEARALLAIEDAWPVELARAMDCVHADRRADVLKALDRCIRTGRGFDLEVPARTAAGQALWLRIIGEAQRASDGRVLRVHGAIQDISESRAARQALAASEERYRHLHAKLAERVEQRTAELQRANDQLQGFAQSLAHDLRAPVAAIQGFAVPLRERLAAVGTERDRQYLDRIRAAADRMDDFIEGLLECATIAQAPLRVEDVDLSAMSRGIVAELEERHPGRTVRVDIQDGLRVSGDVRLLRMCMENLIGNAWKFTGNAARAEIQVAASPTPQGELVYFVRDNGAGFDMAFAGKLFGNFQRLHTQAEFPGTGLGLANVQRIVQRHGGRVWAEAAEGRGATFRWTLGLPAAR